MRCPWNHPRATAALAVLAVLTAAVLTGAMVPARPATECYEYLRCGPTGWTGFVRKKTVDQFVPASHIGLVVISMDNVFCVAIDRSQVVMSDDWDQVIDSEETTCSACQTRWETAQSSIGRATDHR